MKTVIIMINNDNEEHDNNDDNHDNDDNDEEQCEKSAPTEAAGEHNLNNRNCNDNHSLGSTTVGIETQMQEY